MTCRIDDRPHAKRGYAYEDCFNRAFGAAPGWSEISFLLEDVVRAPRERQLDLTQIAAFMVFAVDVEQMQVFYFANLRLTGNKILVAE